MENNWKQLFGKVQRHAQRDKPGSSLNAKGERLHVVAENVRNIGK